MLQLVEARYQSPLVFERTLRPATGLPEPSLAGDVDEKLNVQVVYTSEASVLDAMREACVLAGNLRARIALIVPQVVPYPLPLESPPILIDFSERRLRQLASLSPVETLVRIYLCRDASETLKKVLLPGPPVVICGRRRWWPTRERKLAHKLRKAGHEVVFKEMP
jgi:hypothetical protein